MMNAEPSSPVMKPTDEKVTSAGSQAEETEYCPQQLCNQLNIYRKNGEFCDLMIKVDNVQYPVQKVVMAAFSPYFKAIFCSDSPSVSYEHGEPMLTLNNVDAKVIEDILNYAYLGEIKISMDNVHALLHAANSLKAKSLVNMCCRFLENNISVGNCLELWSLADVYSCRSLRDKAKQFTLANFPSVSEEYEFLKLAEEKLLDVICEDGLYPGDEYDDITVFDAVLRWMHFDEQRKKNFDKVLRHVRLFYVPIVYLNDCFLNDDVLRNSEECLHLLHEVNKYALLHGRRLELESSITRNRLTTGTVQALLISFDRQDLGSAPENNSETGYFLLTEDGRILRNISWPKGGEWEVRLSCGLAIFHKYDFSELCMRPYHPREEKLLEVPPLPKARNQVAICYLDEVLYSIGGWCGAEPCDNVESWLTCDSQISITSDDVWETLAPLPKPVYVPACVTLEGMIYIVGGHVNPTVGASDALQRYDPRRNRWVQLAPLPKKLEFPSACALHRRIYVCASNSDKMYIYDVPTDKWSHAAESHYAIVKGPALLNGRIFAFTELDKDDCLIEVYCTVRDCWREFATIPGIKLTDLQGPLVLTFTEEAKDVGFEVNLLPAPHWYGTRDCASMLPK